MIAQPTRSKNTPTTESFYVFPINGFSFLYSKGLQNSSENFREVLNTLSENVHGALEITSDLIKYTYTNNNLVEGIMSESEIIFYGIPFFYALRVADINSYAKLITI